MTILSYVTGFTLILACAFALEVPGDACGLPDLQATSRTIVPKRFVFEKGWQIPGLKGARVTNTFTDEAGAEELWYEPVDKAETVLQGFEIEADSQTVKLVPGFKQQVDRIVEFRIKGRTYAYDVETVSLADDTHPPMWPESKPKPKPPIKKPIKVVAVVGSEPISGGVLGCGWTWLRYYDADGDGVFESLEYAGFGSPKDNASPELTIPKWAYDQLPNPEAAVRMRGGTAIVRKKSDQAH